MKLEAVRVGAVVNGVVPGRSITVDAIQWHGSQCLNGATSDHDLPRRHGQPFQREPDFAATSVNYDMEELLQRASSTT